LNDSKLFEVYSTEWRGYITALFLAWAIQWDHYHHLVFIASLWMFCRFYFCSFNFVSDP